MESMAMNTFGRIYNKKTVLVTGHTGFKGSWLCLWLTLLGAKVIGYSLPAPTDPAHSALLKLDMVSVTGDIRDKKKVVETMKKYRPDIVFHLAAQPLVKYSYTDPIGTFETNVIGTANVLDACRQTPSVRAIVNVTTDKCYENKEWHWGYRENEPMGGYDPYSASKGCSELVTASYRNSFFNLKTYKKRHKVLLASARAGNVIGGGDWAADRLIPDIVRAAALGKKVEIRYPDSTRPWQHVLEPLSGYLALGQKLLEGRTQYAEAWNFGPKDEDTLCVKAIVENMVEAWPDIRYTVKRKNAVHHEAGLLKLDCSKARSVLNWHPVWTIGQATTVTAFWYKDFYEKRSATAAFWQERSARDIAAYVNDAKAARVAWAR